MWIYCSQSLVASTITDNSGTALIQLCHLLLYVHVTILNYNVATGRYIGLIVHCVSYNAFKLPAPFINSGIT